MDQFVLYNSQCLNLMLVALATSSRISWPSNAALIMGLIQLELVKVWYLELLKSRDQVAQSLLDQATTQIQALTWAL